VSESKKKFGSKQGLNICKCVYQLNVHLCFYASIIFHFYLFVQIGRIQTFSGSVLHISNPTKYTHMCNYYLPKRTLFLHQYYFSFLPTRPEWAYPNFQRFSFAHIESHQIYAYSQLLPANKKHLGFVSTNQSPGAGYIQPIDS